MKKGTQVRRFILLFDKYEGAEEIMIILYYILLLLLLYTKYSILFTLTLYINNKIYTLCTLWWQQLRSELFIAGNPKTLNECKRNYFIMNNSYNALCSAYNGDIWYHAKC